MEVKFSMALIVVLKKTLKLVQGDLSLEELI
jgi:hypothetical protein